MKTQHIILLALFALLSSCKNDEDVKMQADYSAELTNIGENVILETYKALSQEAALLKAATESLELNQTEINLTAARQAWVATRSPWEQSEGFLFGPVDQEGIDPSIDSWPVNVTDLDNVLGSANDLTAAFLAQQEGTLKGFHTIEYLLWGTNGSKAIGDFTAREFEYLAAASSVLASDTQELYDLWRPDSGNFIENVLNAGNGSIVYISQKSALEELANALIIIADEVANGKINDPFAQRDLSLEESRFSANSKADFSDNIRSIRNIYTGVFGTFGDGSSLSNIVSSKNTNLDEQIKEEIEAAIDAIEGITGTFSDAVFNNRSEVESAQTAVRTLQATLEEELLPIFSNL